VTAACRALYRLATPGDLGRLFLTAWLVYALFVNPVGFKQVIYPLDVMLNQSTGLASVDEWQA
jgi:hypothetical protein